jgi:hypothetical protein
MGNIEPLYQSYSGLNALIIVGIIVRLMMAGTPSMRACGWRHFAQTPYYPHRRFGIVFATCFGDYPRVCRRIDNPRVLSGLYRIHCLSLLQCEMFLKARLFVCEVITHPTPGLHPTACFLWQVAERLLVIEW